MSKFKLDSRKAIEAVALLAKRSPGRKIGSKRLLALLYIASRECLKRSGRPMIGGKLVAMRYGPIHGDVYNLIKKKQGAEGLAEWTKHFRNEGYNVLLHADPGLSALSRFEAQVLDEVFEKYEDEDDWDIAHQTHEFTEYRSAFRKGVARAITLEQIIHAVRLSPMITSIVRDLKQKEEMDDLFASAKKQIRQKQEK